MPALVKASGLAILLLGLGFVFRDAGAGLLRRLHPDPAGAALMVLAGGALTAMGAPRQVVAFAGGFVFGPWLGGGLALLAQTLGCCVNFFAARGIGGGWARKRLGAEQTRLERLVRASPFAATLTLRLLPVGSNLLLNLAAGVGGIPAMPFLAASVLGFVPQTAIFAVLGGGTQLGQAAQLALGGAMFVVSFVLAGWLLWGQVGRKDPLLPT